MTKSRIPYSLPDCGSEEINAVAEAISSGWLTSGPKVLEFEQAFKSFLGSDDLYCLAVNSATAGLHLALEALGIEAGDEVIVPSLTFTATAEVVCYLGAKPVIVDVDPATYNLSLESVSNAINHRTKAVIPVHYAGLSCDMNPLISLCSAHNISIVEDAAHALPTTYEENLIGTLHTAATVFSFYANKTMTTGEGGMVVISCPKLAKRISLMRLHGIDRDVYNRFNSELPSWYYEIHDAGFKYNLTDIAASIGLQQLKKLPSFSDIRCKMAKRYFEGLASLPLILPPTARINDNHAWHIFAIRVTGESGLSRNQLIEALSQHGIGTSVHYVPLHRQPFWKKHCSLELEDFPNTEDIYSSILSIPLYTRLSETDQDYIVETLTSLLS